MFPYNISIQASVNLPLSIQMYLLLFIFIQLHLMTFVDNFIHCSAYQSIWNVETWHNLVKKVQFQKNKFISYLYQQILTHLIFFVKILFKSISYLYQQILTPFIFSTCLSPTYINKFCPSYIFFKKFISYLYLCLTSWYH